MVDSIGLNMSREHGPCHLCARDALFVSRAGVPVCGFRCLLGAHADEEGVGTGELLAFLVFGTLMRGIIAVVVVVSIILLLTR